jgi:hypothetical protein
MNAKPILAISRPPIIPRRLVRRGNVGFNFKLHQTTSTENEKLSDHFLTFSGSSHLPPLLHISFVRVRPMMVGLACFGGSGTGSDCFDPFAPIVRRLT